MAPTASSMAENANSPAPVGKQVAEPGILGDHRPARRQIGRAAIAEPAAAESDVLVLGDRELASRRGDVTTIFVEIRGKVQRVPHVPALAQEHLPIRLVVLAQRQLEALLHAGGEIEELEELVVLAPGVALAPEDQLALPLPPVADGREHRAGRRGPLAPEVEDHGLARRPEVVAVRDRQEAIGPAVILPEGEVGAMAIEELDGLRIVLRQLDLDLDRVRLQEDQPVRRAMLGQRQGPAMEVDDPSGRVVEAGRVALRSGRSSGRRRATRETPSGRRGRSGAARRRGRPRPCPSRRGRESSRNIVGVVACAST